MTTTDSTGIYDDGATYGPNPDADADTLSIGAIYDDGNQYGTPGAAR